MSSATHFPQNDSQRTACSHFASVRAFPRDLIYGYARSVPTLTSAQWSGRVAKTGESARRTITQEEK
jgi:hypothetical protein